MLYDDTTPRIFQLSRGEEAATQLKADLFCVTGGIDLRQILYLSRRAATVRLDEPQGSNFVFGTGLCAPEVPEQD